MEIKDCMIGFWVLYKGIPHLIKKIMGNDVVLDTSYNDKDYIVADIKDCEPVVLTNEIIVESAFFESKDKYVLDDNGSMILLSKNTDTNDYSLSIGLCNMSTNITYVHELQMLLKAHKYNVTIDLHRKNCDYKSGNWVSVDHEYYQIQSYVDADDTYVLKPYAIASTTKVVKKDEFQSISITNDILDNIGFKENTDGSYIKIENNAENSYMITYGVDSMWKVINQNTNESYTGYIQYFHQLQNICTMLKINISLHPYSEESKIKDAFDDVY